MNKKIYVTTFEMKAGEMLKKYKEQFEKLKDKIGVDKEAQKILQELKKETYVSPEKLNRRVD